MTLRKLSLLAGVVGALFVFSGLSSSFTWAQEGQEPVVGVVFGDSYASGEGLPGIDPGEAECQRALGRKATNGEISKAWGVTVLENLPVQTSWFAACTGARSEHFMDTPQDTRLLGLLGVNRDKTQYNEAVDGTATDRFDVALASFGGNDLGFIKVIMDCIGIDDAVAGGIQGARAGGWAGGAAGATIGGLTGRCRPGLDSDLRERIDKVVKDNLAPPGVPQRRGPDGHIPG